MMYKKIIYFAVVFGLALTMITACGASPEEEPIAGPGEGPPVHEQTDQPETQPGEPTEPGAPGEQPGHQPGHEPGLQPGDQSGERSGQVPREPHQTPGELEHQQGPQSSLTDEQQPAS